MAQRYLPRNVDRHHHNRPAPDSTPSRKSARVYRYQSLSDELWRDTTNKSKQDAVAAAEKDLTENDWKWIRGEWHW